MLETNSQYDVTPSSIFRVGRVVGVEGREVTVLVDKTKNSAHLLYKGQIVRNTAVGGYVKLAKGFSEIVAKIDGESVGPERNGSARGYRSKRDAVHRELKLSLVGYFTKEGKFKGGVQELPLLDNECFVLTPDELDLVHRFVKPDDVPLGIGTMPMERDQEISIGINEVFASHVGIFGNTGSGKSYTLAKLYYELFNKFGGRASFTDHAKFALIDFNGEYINVKPKGDDATSSSIITDDAKKHEYVLDTSKDGGDRIPFPAIEMRNPELWSVLLDATEKTQVPFLSRALNDDYLEPRLRKDDDIKALIADRVMLAIKVGNQPENKGQLEAFLNEVGGTLTPETAPELGAIVSELRLNLNFHSHDKTFIYTDPNGKPCYADNDSYNADFETLAGRIRALPLKFELRDTRLVRLMIVFRYYWEVFNGYANPEHIGPVIKRLESRVASIDRVIEIDDSKKILQAPLTVFSLKKANLEIKKSIPLLLCKYLYEQKKRDLDHGLGGYLNIIIDEAHIILSGVSNRETDTWKEYRLETFEEIIKEGRKFGAFLTIASQRPYDISPTIISQLHNYFLHRLVNELDLKAVKNSVAYLDKLSADQIPILPTGDCVISGVSTSIPVIASIGALPAEYEPNNKTAKLAEKWLGVDEAEAEEPTGAV